MDPTNNNPVNPASQNPAPVAPVSPAPATPAAPVAPTAPVAPAAPAMPVAPAPTPVTPVNPDVANAALNPPVNPVVTPGANPNSGATMPMNQMFQPQPATAANVFDETTAIAVPEGPKPPDPVEEELKAPLKAAGPVPGSIGSAVSMPPENGAVAPVSGVNEQMMANGINPMAADANSPAGKKPGFFDKMTAKTKMSKSTLILLSVVAGLVVVALVVILVLVATGAL